MRRRSVMIGGALAAATVAAVLAVPRTVVRHPESSGTVRALEARGVPASPREATEPVTAVPDESELASRLGTGRAVIEGLAFTGASDTLDATSEVVLKRLVTALEETPGVYLIEAHVPPSGDMLADQSITDRRAAVVRARLVSAGVAASRLFAMGFGSARASMHGGRARIELSRMP